MGRGSSGIGGGGSKSEFIKNYIINKAENSRLKGVARDARNGTGAYSFKSANAVDAKTAENINGMHFVERDGYTLVHGIVNNKIVFYANNSTSNEIKKLKTISENRQNKLYNEMEKSMKETTGSVKRTTTTYDRARKRRMKNFDAWYFGK